MGYLEAGAWIILAGFQIWIWKEISDLKGGKKMQENEEKEARKEESPEKGEAYKRGYEDGVLAERNRVMRLIERTFRG